MIEVAGLFIIFFFILMLTSRKNLFKVLIVFAAAIAILSYFFNPNPSMDLYRLYQYLGDFRFGGWDSIAKNSYFSSLPLYTIYFYYISKLQLNGLLPMITMFIEYSVLFLFIMKFAKKNDIRKEVILLAVGFFIFSFDYLGAVSGIRNMLAFSIVVLFLYIDLVLNKFKIGSFIIYVALCTFHTSVMVLVLFRVILFFRNKKFINIMAILFLFSSLFIPLILNILNNFSQIKIIKLLISQINAYTASGYMQLSTEGYRALLLIVIIILYILVRRQGKNQYLQLSKFNNYILLVICFTVGFFDNFSTFARFTSFLIMVAPLYIMAYFGTSENRELLKLRKRYFYLGPKFQKTFFWFTVLAVFIAFMYLCRGQYRYMQFFYI